jgi:hypothetical protein
MTSDRSHYQHISDIVSRTQDEIGRLERSSLARNRRQRKRILIRALAWFAILMSVAFAADYLAVRYRIASKRAPFANVEIQNYYAIHKKGGKTELTFAGNQTEVCVNAIFPHLGHAPCTPGGTRIDGSTSDSGTRLRATQCAIHVQHGVMTC